MKTYRFKVGQFECVVLQDKEDRVKAASAFGNAADLEQALREHTIDPEALEISYNIAAVNTGSGWVLIDSGYGGLTGAESCLMAAMEAEGIAREDVTLIILTHAHIDHYGGVLDEAGNFVFPNARYVINREEWKHWTSDERMAEIEAKHEQLAHILRQRLMPMGSRMSFVADGDEIEPGLTAIFAPGHTPGHTAVLVESDGERLLCIGDAAVHPLHLKYLDWQFGNDTDHGAAKETKRRLLDTANARGARIMGYHFPFPGFFS